MSPISSLSRRPHQKGRPRLVGSRLPILEARQADAMTSWTRLRVAHWYGWGEREVEIVSETAVWYHTSLPSVPIRWAHHPRSRGPLPDPGAPLHRLGSLPRPNPRLVRTTLAGGSHLSCHAGAPGHGDPAAVVRARDCPDALGPLRPIFAGHAAGASPLLPHHTAPPADGLVYQGIAHVCRRVSPGAPSVVGISAFSDISAHD